MNREQFTELVKREQAELRRFLLALCCGDSFQADDIAQETLVKAYLSCAGYQEQGKFTAWIYKIAHRTFLDFKRSCRQDGPLDKSGHIYDQTDNADCAFRYEELYLALEGLPPKERTSLLLFYIKGYSVKEIARIVDCNEDAVKKQLSRGRDHLKQKMKK